LRDLLHLRWRIVFIDRTVAMTFSASIIFPRSERNRKNLDEHYRTLKRLMIGSVLLAEGAAFA
jgi:hypothetical protein